MRDTPAMTLFALAFGLAATLALFFGSFAFAYLVQVARGGPFPFGRFVGVAVVAAAAGTAAVWMGRILWARLRQSRSSDP